MEKIQGFEKFKSNSPGFEISANPELVSIDGFDT